VEACHRDTERGDAETEETKIYGLSAVKYLRSELDLKAAA
jgi:hypothetical protein